MRGNERVDAIRNEHGSCLQTTQITKVNNKRWLDGYTRYRHATITDDENLDFCGLSYASTRNNFWFRAKWKISALERSGEVPELPDAVQSFETAPFSRRIKDALATAGFAAPSPIQAQSWPIAVQGSDLVAVAKTGSGKTLAFLLPAFKIIARWSKEATSSDPPVLCLAPTRELATQIDAECKRFAPELAKLPKEDVVDLRALKQELQKTCGLSRFRQMLLYGSRVVDEIPTQDAPLDLQLVLLPFPPASQEKVDELLRAAASGAVSLVEEILMRPQDPNLPEHMEAITPLYESSYWGHLEIVRLLLEAMAEPNLATDSGTPLLAASLHGHVESMRLLLEARADVHRGNSEGKTPLWAAARSGDVESVQLLLEKGAQKEQVAQSFKAWQDWERETTALAAAAGNGHVSVVQVLLGAAADVGVQNAFGFTPLELASRAGHAEVVRLLLEHATATGRVFRCNVGLRLAAQKGHAGVVGLLIQAKADKDDVDQEGSALCVASLAGKAGVARQLLELRADHRLSNSRGATPLWNAAFQGFADIVSLLLAARADMEHADHEGATPVWIAAFTGHLPILRLFCEAKVRSMAVFGGTPKGPQGKALKHAVPQVLVATPGRLQDFMGSGEVSLGQVQLLVLDEADRMLDMGFEPEIAKILAEAPAERQTLLFT
ncbi:ANK1, partial [Symbiodinium microadriaticum]